MTSTNHVFRFDSKGKPTKALITKRKDIQKCFPKIIKDTQAYIPQYLETQKGKKFVPSNYAIGTKVITA